MDFGGDYGAPSGRAPPAARPGHPWPAQHGGAGRGGYERAEPWVVVSGFRPEDYLGVRSVFDHCGVVGAAHMAAGALWVQYASTAATALALAKNNTNVFGGVWVKVAQSSAGPPQAMPPPPRQANPPDAPSRADPGAAVPPPPGAGLQGPPPGPDAVAFPQASLLASRLDREEAEEAIVHTPAARPPFSLRWSFLSRPMRAFANRDASGVPIPERLFEGQQMRFGVPLPDPRAAPDAPAARP
eukprot:TRINITY_DN1148_c0_g2_i4.p2 TRINITY_DN1148_c0_g2~~TRINITY_DN1148_c0_g2_i4.p2  ORF type:complete len:263 (+),score=61.49 TRINITY_DN1148_c0_g2_i4:65-790(+)